MQGKVEDLKSQFSIVCFTASIYLIFPI